MLIYYLVKPIDGEENEAVYLSTLFCCGSEVRGNQELLNQYLKQRQHIQGNMPIQLS